MGLLSRTTTTMISSSTSIAAFRWRPSSIRNTSGSRNILVSTCRDLLQRGSMKLLGAMLVTLLEYPDRPWDWTAPSGKEDHLAVGYWKTGSKTESDWEGVVQPRSLDPSIVYPKEQALLDICRREVQAGNQVWIVRANDGKRDIQPRLKQILTEAGFRVAIMRSKSVKTRDRLDWIKKEGKKSGHRDLASAVGPDRARLLRQGRRNAQLQLHCVLRKRATTRSRCSRQLAVRGGSARPRTVVSTTCTTRRRCSSGRWRSWLARWPRCWPWTAG